MSYNFSTESVRNLLTIPGRFLSMTSFNRHRVFKTSLVLLSCLALTVLATTAFAASTIAVSPDPVNDFGVVNLGSTSVEQILTITNDGDSPLDVDSMNISGADFFYDPLRGTEPCASGSPIIPPGGSCTMCVVLSPSSEGAKNAVLTIDSNAQNQSQFNLDLSGEGSSQQEFNDVPASHWAEDYIHTLFYNGITSGYGDGTYRPSVNVDRAQMAVYIVRALEGEPAQECTADPFTDVPASHWACKYIRRISDLGISTGYGDGTYRPANLVSRAQMAVYITKGYLVFIDYPSIAVSPLSYDFGDVIEGNTSAEQVFTIRNTGIADLDITDITLTGTDSAEFTLDLNGGSTPCGSAATVLSAGNACTVTAAFSPTNPGGKSANLSVTSNDPENPAHNVSLTGNGIPQVQHTLTVSKLGDGFGTVTSTPAGIDCGADCTELYGEGTVVTLTATPAPGSTFFGWVNVGCVTGPCQVTMNYDINAGAMFILEGAGGGNINYENIPLTYNGIYYIGSLYGEQIGPKPAQKFYSVTRPAACTTQVQFFLSGNVAGYVNANMLVSDADFGTTQDAMSDYTYMLSTYGYYNDVTTTYNGDTYYFNFNMSPDSEMFTRTGPTADVYYIEVVNEDSSGGYYNIKANCF